MRLRLFVSFFAVCLAAMAQTLTVDKLVQFIQSSEPMLKRGTMTDKDIAQYLAKAKMAERLDDRTIETIQGFGVGPRTLKELQRLRDESSGLAAAKSVEKLQPAQAPPPSSEQQAAIIDDVRAYALAYSKRLPDFICTEVQRRFVAPRARVRTREAADGDPDWQMYDSVTIRLSFFEQKEDYKVVLHNNRVTDEDYRKLGGLAVTGDFGTLMREIFERSTQAHFEWDHWATLRTRPAMAFAYHVAQANSHWSVAVPPDHEIIPAYKGLIYVDADSHEVLRVTLEAVNVPPDFPMKSVQEILDYGYTDLSGQQYLLPLKAQSLTVMDEGTMRNDTEFRLYRKYSAESILKFDTETPAPLPDSETKETPAAPSKKK